MSGCPEGGKDFCTKAECAKLKAEIKELKSDIQILRIAIDRHAKGCISFSGGAHRWCGTVPKAITGKPGKDGKPGKNGKDGKPGKNGRDGSNGRNGQDGRDGSNGSNGRNGRDGRDGSNGRNGQDGRTITVYPPAPIVRPPSVSIQPTINIEAIIPIIVGIVYAKVEANLNITLAPRITLAVKNEFALQINAIIALIYAKLEATLKVEINNQINIKLPSIETNLYTKLLIQLNLKIINEINLKMPNLNIDFSPVLNVLVRMQNQLNIQQNNQLNIQNNLNIQQNNLLDIQAQLNIQQNNLSTIEDKVTPEVFIRKGECIEPSEEGDWYQYNELPATQGKGFQEILTYLTYQVEDLHKETCKAVQPKVTPKALPKLIECVENSETGKMEVKELSLETMQANFGFVAPWLIGATKKYLVPFVIDKAIDWGQKLLTEQTKKTYELTCNSVDNNPYILYNDEHNGITNQGNYLIVNWVLESNPKQSVYNNSHFQVRNPVETLITNDLDILKENWDRHFRNLYKILGPCHVKFYTASDTKFARHRGYFLDHIEAERFFKYIYDKNNSTHFCKDGIRSANNPKYADIKNQTYVPKHSGEKLIAKKITIIKKDSLDSDDFTKLCEYFNPDI
jgi:hypothetical protein